MKSSDIFDLISSLSYQEKVANASFINVQVVGNPNILSKKDSNEYRINEVFLFSFCDLLLFLFSSKL